MRCCKWLSFFVLVPLAAACAQGSTLEGLGGSGRGGGTPAGNGGGTDGSGGSSTSGQASSSGNSGNPPASCSLAGGYAGCCAGNTNYYCPKGSSKITPNVCASGQVCGWISKDGYYGCVAPPGEADPSHEYPIACQ